MPEGVVKEFEDALGKSPVMKDFELLEEIIDMGYVMHNPSRLIVERHCDNFTKVKFKGIDDEVYNCLGNVYLETDEDYNIFGDIPLTEIESGRGASRTAGGRSKHTEELMTEVRKIFAGKEELTDEDDINVLIYSSGLLANFGFFNTIEKLTPEKVNFIVAKDAHSSIMSPMKDIVDRYADAAAKRHAQETSRIQGKIIAEHDKEDDANREVIENLKQELVQLKKEENRFRMRFFNEKGSPEEIKKDIKKSIVPGYINVVIANGIGSTSGKYGPWPVLDELAYELEDERNDAISRRDAEIAEKGSSDIVIPTGVLTYMDDAHNSAGGKDRRGTWGKLGIRRPDIVMWTLSKNLKSVGGFLVSSKRIIKAFGLDPSQIFTADTPDTTVVPVLQRLKYFKAHPEKVERLEQNSNRLYDRLENAGIDVAYTDRDTPIFKVAIERLPYEIKLKGDDEGTIKQKDTAYDFRCIEEHQRLIVEDKVAGGLFISVASGLDGKNFIRISINSNFRDEQVDELGDKIINFHRRLTPVDIVEAGAAD